MSLALRDYRALIGLDESFVAPAPLPEKHRAGAISKLLNFFKAEGRHAVDHLGALDALRALLTIRSPQAIDNVTANALDALLQSLALERRGPDATALPSLSEQIPSSHYAAAHRCVLWRGDITTLQADAIVNAANAQLLGCFQPFHRCIDNAIHWFAGPQVRLDCARLMALEGEQESTGRAKITRAYNLPSRYILHTVGPIVRTSLTPTHRRQLADSYRACLALAHEMGTIRTIAFCGISTGVFGFPKEEAARIAMQVLETWFEHYSGPIEKVIINVFSEEDQRAYLDILK